MAESTIIYELIPYIDATYRTIASAAGRALQGFSMGAQGCERIAFKFPQYWSSIYCLAPAIDDNSSNIAANEATAYVQMLNSNAAAYDPLSVWGLSTTNASAIKAQGFPIHVLIGDQDALYTASGCSPSGGHCQQDLYTQLDGLGIAHDALQLAPGCGHDGACLIAAFNADFIDFASAHFP